MNSVATGDNATCGTCKDLALDVAARRWVAMGGSTSSRNICLFPAAAAAAVDAAVSAVRDEPIS